jgi:hypothetical protein
VERALRNLFRLRIRLGMLDPPSMVPYYDVRYNDTELEFNAQHVGVAKKAALEAMTLYKNEKETLPLDGGKIKSVALIGPQGPNAGLLFGNYAGSANGGNWGMSIEQGLSAALAKAGGGGKVIQVDGLSSIGAPTSNDSFAAASKAAAAADVTVVTLGLAFDSYCDHHPGGGDVCEVRKKRSLFAPVSTHNRTFAETGSGPTYRESSRTNGGRSLAGGGPRPPDDRAPSRSGGDGRCLAQSHRAVQEAHCGAHPRRYNRL